MGWIEYLLIVAGSSLEIFVAMECQGSLIQKVNKKQLTAICFIVAVCQLLAMYIGYFLSSFLNGKYSVKDEALLGEIISIGILIGLGIRLIGKAIRNERSVKDCRNHRILYGSCRNSIRLSWYRTFHHYDNGGAAHCRLYSGRHLHRISFRFRAEDKGIYRGGDTLLGGWN